MGIDATERRERHQARKPARRNNEKRYAPYADIQHRIIDAPAFKSLSGNECRLLLVLAHQVSLEKNGWLVASPGFCESFGFVSHHTLKSAIDGLVAQGLLVRTRSYSAGGAAARYAVPWSPLCKETNGLFLESWHDRICNVDMRPCFKDLARIHPHAAIDHKVIKSPAFADLKPMSCKLMIILARQLTMPNNNGHLQACFEFCKKFGFGSKGTLSSAIDDLIAHGFVYPTHRHGKRHVTSGRNSSVGWNKYALTWRPVDNRAGLNLEDFKMFAWEDWGLPAEKKTSRQILVSSAAEDVPKPGRNWGASDISTAEIGASGVAKSGHYVHVPLLSGAVPPNERQLQVNLKVPNAHCANEHSHIALIGAKSNCRSSNRSRNNSIVRSGIRYLVQVCKKMIDAGRKAWLFEIDNGASSEKVLLQLPCTTPEPTGLHAISAATDALGISIEFNMV